MREGSAPNFCPPTQEGITLTFQDEEGTEIQMEFVGMVLHDDRRYAFFFPIDEDNPVGSSGELVVLEAVELDDEGQPDAFELVEDPQIAMDAYQAFKDASAALYDFE